MRTPVLHISLFISLLLAGVLSIATLGVCFAQSSFTSQSTTQLSNEDKTGDIFSPSRIQVFDKQENLMIDEAVAIGDSSYWLHHSIDGMPSIAGTPFLDERCSGSSQHLMIYGHHIGSTGVFGPISKSFKQETFDSIGEIKLTVCNAEGISKELSFAPCCAARVLEDEQVIQQVSFSDKDEYGEWISTIYESAQARSSQSPQGDITSQSLSLVTCSEDTPNQPWRCVLTCLPE